MALPKTVEDMETAGYTHLNDTTCRSELCGVDISWYRTPLGKKIPMDKGSATPHWETCPDADRFRK